MGQFAPETPDQRAHPNGPTGALTQAAAAVPQASALNATELANSPNQDFGVLKKRGEIGDDGGGMGEMEK